MRGIAFHTLRESIKLGENIDNWYVQCQALDCATGENQWLSAITVLYMSFTSTHNKFGR